MFDSTKFYINGEWVFPVDKELKSIINPSTEEAIKDISLGVAEDVNLAVTAARESFESWSLVGRDERIHYLEKIIEGYKAHYDDFSSIISAQMGAPIKLAHDAHAAMGLAHFSVALEVLKNFNFYQDIGSTRVFKEPIGVCGLITPWNWPINQVACKVAPALAVGCTVVLKPSELAPLDAMLLAKVIDEAGIPKGVFNLVNGDGATVGKAISEHPDIDMVSITGSTEAGVLVAKSAADTIKRVSQELGGKSANIILDDADFESVVERDVFGCFLNSGQSCNAPTRMLVPEDKLDTVIDIAKAAAAKITVGSSSDETVYMGPLANAKQWDRVQQYIKTGIDEGATLIAGGLGRPSHLDKGYFAKPTIFCHVDNTMRIAREEIFGPVLSIITYKDEAEAIAIANDSEFGLSGYVSSSNLERARNVAKKLHTGMVHLNGAGVDPAAPFGGFKKSGNGREWGESGFMEFLEIKSVIGYSE